MTGSPRWRVGDGEESHLFRYKPENDMAREEVWESRAVTNLGVLAAEGAKFGCIYADPPWSYENESTRASADSVYPTMSLAEIAALPVGGLAAENAHCHLWTTNAFLRDSFDMMEAWGFQYKSLFVWVKPQMGIGNYWRVSHELLLTGIRGDATRFNDHGLKSWLSADRLEHSHKPEVIRVLIERASPGPYLELFGRREAPGWTVWGNQIEKGLFGK